MRVINLASISSLLIVISGCSNIRNYTMPDDANLLSGAGVIAVASDKYKENNTKQFEEVNVDDLLKNYGFEDLKLIEKNTESEDYKHRRNEVQDRLIAASNQRCDIYIRTLIASKAQTQMGWSGLATLLTGAATIVTPISAARILSAGATVSLGVLNTYNEVYFNNLTVQLISSGIKKQRTAALVNIQAYRKDSLVDYPVNRAIADALSYHGMCNILTGLETASNATNSLEVKELAKESALKP